MLALSNPLFPRVHGWALEDVITHNLASDCNEANSYDPLLEFHTYGQINHDFAPEYSISSVATATGGGGGTGDETKVVKKLNHNASERDRRKRVNELYAFLGSLLPILSNQKKKLSIPKTVTRALKYIPELQKEVETLRCKKEKILSYSTTVKTTQDHRGIKNQIAKEDAMINTKSSSISSINILGDKEVVIQLISSANDHMNKNKEVNLLSKVLEYLENEENELVLINATSFKCSGEGMLLSTLHIQVQGDRKIEAEKLKAKLDSFHR